MGKTKDKKEKKEKKERKSSISSTAEDNYDELVKRVNPISQPLASKKLCKRAYKSVKRAAKAKQLCRGVKEVGKALRKGADGVCIIAGDISPIDVVTHLPVLCEDSKVPYVFVPSKEELGAAGQTKRPTSVVLLKKSDSVEGLAEFITEVAALPRSG